MAKIKGEAERDIGKFKFPFLTIFKPSVILNRENDKRYSDMIWSIMPMVDKIDVKFMGRTMAEHIFESVKRIDESNQVSILNNESITHFGNKFMPPPVQGAQ